MKQSYFTDATELFRDVVRKYTFKTMTIWDSYALLARANHGLAMDFAILGEKSALSRRIDCFECLSPTENAA